MRTAGMKVGELARRTGVSVRTLHHYDQIGLLQPSRRTDSGHRLYAEPDIVRLQQIVSLRQLGFSLDEIGSWLDRGGMSPLRTIEEHLRRLREQIQHEQELCRRLERVADGMRAGEDVSVEEFIQGIRGVTMIEKYYTPEQLAQLKERARTLGADRIREVEAEWPRLIAEVRAEMQRATDPASPTMQRLAARWTNLVREFTGGDPGITKALGELHKHEPTIAQAHGCDLDPELFAYVSKAMAASARPPSPPSA